ncbi:hypothetical protein I7I48_04192 [Histoplasma ohiense]|nr:hypothetical protein I7I48_04192 [Histoplasma ohiense (nom. inval.)]
MQLTFVFNWWAPLYYGVVLSSQGFFWWELGGCKNQKMDPFSCFCTFGRGETRGGSGFWIFPCPHLESPLGEKPKKKKLKNKNKNPLKPETISVRCQPSKVFSRNRLNNYRCTHVWD